MLDDCRSASDPVRLENGARERLQRCRLFRSRVAMPDFQCHIKGVCCVHAAEVHCSARASAQASVDQLIPCAAPRGSFLFPAAGIILACVIIEVTFPRELPLFPTAIVHVVGYTKLRVWGLTQYERIVYIDADALVMNCVDELSCRAYACALVAGRGWGRNPSIEENVYFSRLFWPDLACVPYLAALGMDDLSPKRLMVLIS